MATGAGLPGSPSICWGYKGWLLHTFNTVSRQKHRRKGHTARWDRSFDPLQSAHGELQGDSSVMPDPCQGA